MPEEPRRYLFHPLERRGVLLGLQPLQIAWILAGVLAAVVAGRAAPWPRRAGGLRSWSSHRGRGCTVVPGGEAGRGLGRGGGRVAGPARPGSLARPRVRRRPGRPGGRGRRCRSGPGWVLRGAKPGAVDAGPAPAGSSAAPTPRPRSVGARTGGHRARRSGGGTRPARPGARPGPTGVLVGGGPSRPRPGVFPAGPGRSGRVPGRLAGRPRRPGPARDTSPADPVGSPQRADRRWGPAVGPDPAPLGPVGSSYRDLVAAEADAIQAHEVWLVLAVGGRSDTGPVGTGRLTACGVRSGSSMASSATPTCAPTLPLTGTPWSRPSPKPMIWAVGAGPGADPAVAGGGGGGLVRASRRRVVARHVLDRGVAPDRGGRRLPVPCCCWPPADRPLSVIMAPVPPERAAREVRSARTADVADEELRSRAGFLPSARRGREADGVVQREAELAEGHAEYRYSGYVTVTAANPIELAAACIEAEQRAQASHLELRRLYGRQAEAFTWTLPLARGLASKQPSSSPGAPPPNCNACTPSCRRVG